MASLEETRFEISSSRFNQTISRLPPGDESAWSILDSRQFEIMDATVTKSTKAQAMDRVLWEISRLHPRADTAYCQALEKRVALTDKKDQTDLLRLAQDAYMHRRTANITLYGKIIYDIYQKLSPDNKKTFSHKATAQSYRKAVLGQQNSQEKEETEQQLREIDFYLEDPATDPDRKLGLIDDVLKLVRDKHFGPVEANRIKAAYCADAINICRQELHDPYTAEYYSEQKKEYERRSDNAKRKWSQRRGLWTSEQEQAYLQKYRTDKER